MGALIHSVTRNSSSGRGVNPEKSKATDTKLRKFKTVIKCDRYREGKILKLSQKLDYLMMSYVMVISGLLSRWLGVRVLPGAPGISRVSGKHPFKEDQFSPPIPHLRAQSPCVSVGKRWGNFRDGLSPSQNLPL